MLNKIFIRIVSCILVTIISISVCGTVFAETGENGSTVVIPESSALINAEIINNFNETVDLDVGCYVNLEYDSQGRINKIIGKSGNVQEIINITHYDDGTYSQERIVDSIDNVAEITTYSAENNIELLSTDDGSYDYKMADSAVKKRIQEAQEVWNNAPDMRDLAHTEALIARADYCVVYPKSSFADLFLEDGSLNTGGLHFKRTLKYTSPQMYGNDIIALQRALMAYGYLESTDVKAGEYGYFGPSTEAAVIDYQTEKGLGIDGQAGPATLKLMFSAGSDNNKSKVTFEGLNKINVFRLKHDAVCVALAAKLGPTIYREAYIDGAGLKHRGGRADVIRVSGASKMVWEVKPDSKYGKATGKTQVNTYVDSSKLPANAGRAYCPLTHGSNITAFSFPWTNGQQVYVSSACADGTSAPGVVFYSDKKGLNPIYQPSFSPVVVPKPNEDYYRITWPEPRTVYTGLVAAGVVVGSYYLAKGIFALAAMIPSGGLSLLLLCF